jgi:hypothetical protein
VWVVQQHRCVCFIIEKESKGESGVGEEPQITKIIENYYQQNNSKAEE